MAWPSSTACRPGARQCSAWRDRRGCVVDTERADPWIQRSARSVSCRDLSASRGPPRLTHSRSADQTTITSLENKAQDSVGGPASTSEGSSESSTEKSSSNSYNESSSQSSDSEKKSIE